MDRVPFSDLRRQYAPIRDELHEAAMRVLDSGRYVGGPEISSFEREMAAWLGVPEVCGASCATMGLFAVLRSLGVKAGDEVITTPHTAIATAEAISLTGARVVFADVRRGYFFLDPDEVERKITGRTRAVIPVHLYGQPAEMDALLALAREHGLALVEDCAQAQGARYNGRMVGTMGDAAVFSFFPSKTLGGFGDGGAVVARDPALLRRIRMFSNHGRETKYDHLSEGINSRLDAIQAALLRVCLRRLDGWNEARRRVAARYDAALAGIAEVRLPAVVPGTTPVYHLYVILVPDREALASHLEKAGVETGLHYPSALNLLPAYAHMGQGPGSFPNAEYVCEHCLSLPVFPGMTDGEIDQVCAAVRGFYGSG